MSNSDGGRGHCDCYTMNHHHQHHHHHHHSPDPGDIHALHDSQSQAVWLRSESNENSDIQLYEPVDDIQRSRGVFCSGVDLPSCANCALQHRNDGSSALHSPEHTFRQEAAEEQCLLPPPAPSSQINAHSDEEKNTFSYISDINRQTAECKLKRKPAVPPRNTSLKPN